jgi:hypothetical protein
MSNSYGSFDNDNDDFDVVSDQNQEYRTVDIPSNTSKSNTSKSNTSNTLDQSEYSSCPTIEKKEDIQITFNNLAISKTSSLTDILINLHDKRAELSRTSSNVEFEYLQRIAELEKLKISYTKEKNATLARITEDINKINIDIENAKKNNFNAIIQSIKYCINYHGPSTKELVEILSKHNIHNVIVCGNHNDLIAVQNKMNSISNKFFNREDCIVLYLNENIINIYYYRFASAPVKELKFYLINKVVVNSETFASYPLEEFLSNLCPSYLTNQPLSDNNIEHKVIYNFIPKNVIDRSMGYPMERKIVFLPLLNNDADLEKFISLSGFQGFLFRNSSQFSYFSITNNLKNKEKISQEHNNKFLFKFIVENRSYVSKFENYTPSNGNNVPHEPYEITRIILAISQIASK